MERSGLYHLGHSGLNTDGFSTDFVESPLLPSDGKKDIVPVAESRLKDEAFHKATPILSYAMHVSNNLTEEGLEKWAKQRQFEAYTGRPNWWYCNQNQYAAYRYQYQFGAVDVIERQGDRVRVAVKRPMLLDLNDATPLTLRVGNVAPAEVVSVSCATAAVEPSKREHASHTFSVLHDRDQRLPEKIGIIGNNHNRAELGDDNVDADVPGLKALVHFRDGSLVVTLSNEGAEPITNVRATYRAPLMWKEGVVRRQLADLAPGARGEDRLVLTSATDDGKYLEGDALHIVQLDFSIGGKAGRVHLYTRVDSERERDASYPKRGFWKLGPVKADALDKVALVAALDQGGELLDSALGRAWRLPDGARTEWVLKGNDVEATSTDEDAYEDSAHPKAWTASNHGFRPGAFLDVEVIHTFGEDYAQGYGTCLLQTVVVSETDQTVDFLLYPSGPNRSVARIFLNGEIVKDKGARLRQGENRLALVCQATSRPDGCSPENNGSFFRIADPETGRRLTNVRYEPDRVALVGSGVFQAPAAKTSSD
jgi:hypothetical protein